MAQPAPPPYSGGPYEKPPPYAPNADVPPYPTQGMPMPTVAPPGWGPPPNQPYTYGATTVVVEPVAVPATHVILVGGCPSCRVGVLEDNFSCLGIFCALFFFPIGILCCLAMREKRCTNCGASF